MHAPPAFQLSVHRFGVWRCALGSIGLLVLATLLGWLVSSPFGWRGLLTVPALACLLPLWSLADRPAFNLRWDTQCWHLGPLATRGQEPVSGQLQVALDFGGWMLLRLQTSGSAPWYQRSHWLPVQRRGHEHGWHALRCTVYSVHPGAARVPAVH